jgi:hypothetical protein
VRERFAPVIDLRETSEPRVACVQGLLAVFLAGFDPGSSFPGGSI